MNDMKQFFNTKEISDILGDVSLKTIERRAKKETWSSRPRQGKGGGKEYALVSLPSPTKEALLKALVKEEIKKDSSFLIQKDKKLEGASFQKESLPPLNHHLKIENARLCVCRKFDKLIQGGASFLKAYELILELSKELSPDGEAIKKALILSNQKGEKPLAYQSLKRIYRAFKGGESLYPKRWAGKKDILNGFLPLFLKHYQLPQKPSVNQAYHHFTLELEGNHPNLKNETIPSIHQVRRVLEKMGVVKLNKKRLGGKALSSIKPFARRETSNLLPLQVWVGDGHTFDAEAINPFSGKPFRPEITLIMDAHSRLLVGWSMDLSENRFAVANALKNSVISYGIPSIYYGDNGRGQRNHMLDDVETGILPRLGITHKTGIPGRSQARGNIERLHQSICVRAASRLPSFINKRMDEDASHQFHKLTRRELRLKGATQSLPVWDEVIEVMKAEVNRYNHAPHRSLPKKEGAFMSPFEYHQAKLKEASLIPEIPSEMALNLLFQPRIKRTIKRGEVLFGGEVYFSNDLLQLNGKEVEVAFEPTEALKVWIYHQNQFIATANFRANSGDYFPKSEIERSSIGRAKGRLKRIIPKVEAIKDEMEGVLGSKKKEADFSVFDGCSQRFLERDEAYAEDFPTFKESRKNPNFERLFEKKEPQQQKEEPVTFEKEEARTIPKLYEQKESSPKLY